MPNSTKPKKKPAKSDSTGRLRIGNNWNAITIIALSQNNPLKAIAEFVENSIDAKAEHISIIRGKEKGEPYLKLIDDGNGIPLDDEGKPDFKYVATHICDSLKKRLKRDGAKGIQGEFGIGLLSFWTLGERLALSSADREGHSYQMEMMRNEPGFKITQRRLLFSHSGVELVIHPLLPGIRQLSGEKIQGYLASELRDRIRTSGVKISIRDRQARKELEVHPRKYPGIKLHQFNWIECLMGEVTVELYIDAPRADNHIELFRSGTRVLPDIGVIDQLNNEPWNSDYLVGMVDAPFLQLTPGTRDGVIRDEMFESFLQALAKIEEPLQSVIAKAKEAAEEEASRNVLKSVRRALTEAFLTLPPEDYGWLDINISGSGRGSAGKSDAKQRAVLADQDATGIAVSEDGVNQGQSTEELRSKREFFEHAGPLHSAIISPASAVVHVGDARTLRCIPRDKSRRVVESDLELAWEIAEGSGLIDTPNGEIVAFTAPDEPQLVEVEVTVSQQTVSGEVLTCKARATITVTESLLPKDEKRDGADKSKGLPGYTYRRSPGELWRSQYDEKNNIIVINNGHKDFVFAAQKKARKLRYICQLFAKELVLHNFPGFTGNELLERMVELYLYTEENLR